LVTPERGGSIASTPKITTMVSGKTASRVRRFFVIMLGRHAPSRSSSVFSSNSFEMASRSGGSCWPALDHAADVVLVHCVLVVQAEPLLLLRATGLLGRIGDFR
jgi:hypothetical protein